MSLVTLRRGAKSARRRARLMREVSTEASSLAQLDAECVLVVYGEKDARIYYEPEPDSPTAPHPPPKGNPKAS